MFEVRERIQLQFNDCLFVIRMTERKKDSIGLSFNHYIMKREREKQADVMREQILLEKAQSCN